jgi:hypothetical protein
MDGGGRKGGDRIAYHLACEEGAPSERGGGGGGASRRGRGLESEGTWVRLYIGYVGLAACWALLTQSWPGTDECGILYWA